MSQCVRVGVTREVAGGRCVSQQRVRGVVVVDGVKAWRERGKVGFSEWKGRSAPVVGVSDRLVTAHAIHTPALHAGEGGVDG